MKHLRIKINKFEIREKDILKNIDFILNKKDRIALVGNNGAGKTTLMKIITQEHLEFDGIIENIGNMSIGYLSQIYSDNENKTVREELKDGFKDIINTEKHLKKLEENMEKNPENMQIIEEYTELLEKFNNIGGYNYNNQIHNVANGMGILDLLEKKLINVSGGQRTKIALAKILLESPDILLLDEPTNFIDLKSIEWLENYLQNKWNGGYLIISHDREFLDKTCDKTYEIQPARAINFYHCNYTDYVIERAKREKKSLGVWERQQEYIKKEENLINRFRAGSRASWAKSRGKALEKLEKIAKPYIPKKPKFFFEKAEESNDRILFFKECFIGRTEPLFFINELTLSAGQRVGIMGENGVGKSTFIKTILKEIELLDGQMLRGKGIRTSYYSQMHEELDKQKTLRDNFENHGFFFTDEQLIGILNHYLFKREDLDKKIKYLSGGQISKLLFAIIGQKESNLLILDEPTNHLDYDTREALEESLNKFKGTVLFISHDRYFMNKLASNLWIIKDEELTIAYGNYEDYLYKLEHGLDLDATLFDENAQMDSVLVDKLGEAEAKRIKDKFTRKKKRKWGK